MEQKRQYRELEQETKDKISQATKNKPKSFHKEWQNIGKQSHQDQLQRVVALPLIKVKFWGISNDKIH